MLRAKAIFFAIALISALRLDVSGQCGASITGLDGSISFSIPNRGAAVYSTSDANRGLTVGYAAVQASTGSRTAAGYQVVSFKKNGVSVSEASVPEVRPITSGRIYVSYFAAVNTGVAMVNPNSTDAIISFYFTPGFLFCDCPNPPIGTFRLPAHSQIARFVNEAPFNVSFGPSIGSMTFSSSVPIGVIAMRGYTNQRGEFLMTTLPVADLNEPASNDVVFLPHYADGGGWTTMVTMVNPTDAAISGSVQFLGPGGATKLYLIPPRDVASISTPGTNGAITTGAIRVMPDPGSTSPSASAIFTFSNGGIVVSEAGAPALRPAQSFRLFDVECNSPIGPLQTGVAMANPSATDTATVTLDLMDMNGRSTGQTSTLMIPPLGQTVAFMKQFPGLESIPDQFVGVVRISTTSPAGVAVIGLRSRYNERNDFLITTSMPVNEATPPSSADALFPHLANGGGYNTEFVLFSGSADETSAGTLQLFSQSGGRLN
jgi:hypothetical protein